MQASPGARAGARVLRGFLDASVTADGDAFDVARVLSTAALDAAPMLPFREALAAALRLRAAGFIWFADSCDRGGITAAGRAALAAEDRAAIG
jgi:hypothetical protein